MSTNDMRDMYVSFNDVDQMFNIDVYENFPDEHDEPTRIRINIDNLEFDRLEETLVPILLLAKKDFSDKELDKLCELVHVEWYFWFGDEDEDEEEVWNKEEVTAGLFKHGDPSGDFVTISKIVVPTEYDKEQLLKAFKYIHNLRTIDSDYCGVNTIMHMYQHPELIEVEQKIEDVRITKDHVRYEECLNDKGDFDYDEYNTQTLILMGR